MGFKVKSALTAILCLPQLQHAESHLVSSGPEVSIDAGLSNAR